MQIGSIWTVIYALRSHFGPWFPYGFNQIKPSLSAFLLPKSGWEMVLWEDCFGRRHRIFSHSKTQQRSQMIHHSGGQMVLKLKRSKLESFPLSLSSFWFGLGFGVCFTKNAPQMSMNGPREQSSVITSLPQRQLAFRILLFDLPPVPCIFWFLPYYSSWLLCG